MRSYYQRNQAWEYAKAVLLAIPMLAIIFLVMYGSWWLFVDTGRAIIHP